MSTTNLLLCTCTLKFLFSHHAMLVFWSWLRGPDEGGRHTDFSLLVVTGLNFTPSSYSIFSTDFVVFLSQHITTLNFWKSAELSLETYGGPRSKTLVLARRQLQILNQTCILWWILPTPSLTSIKWKIWVVWVNLDRQLWMCWIIIRSVRQHRRMHCRYCRHRPHKYQPLLLRQQRMTFFIINCCHNIPHYRSPSCLCNPKSSLEGSSFLYPPWKPRNSSSCCNGSKQFNNFCSSSGSNCNTNRIDRSIFKMSIRRVFFR